MWPDNLVKAMLYQAASKSATSVKKTNLTFVNGTVNETRQVEVPTTTTKVIYSEGTNVMGLVVFSIFFGIVISRMGKRAVLVRQYFQEINDAILELVKIIIW